MLSGNSDDDRYLTKNDDGYSFFLPTASDVLAAQSWGGKVDSPLLLKS